VSDDRHTAAGELAAAATVAPAAPASPQTAAKPAVVFPTTPVVAASSLVEGDIVWVRMPKSHTVGSEMYKDRPWVVLSNYSFLQSSKGIWHGAPMSTQIVGKEDREEYVFIDPADVQADDNSIGFATVVVCCHLARSLADLRIIRHSGRILKASRKKLDDIRAGVGFVYGI
jgi:mRNA-degrading endonuclease toxin of MazEF toxin-antitoxin module